MYPSTYRVNGATGATGNHTIAALLEAGETVHAMAHRNRGLFAGMNNMVEQMTGRPPMSIELFVERHREAFSLAAN